MSNRVRHGVDPELEAQADALLRQSFLDQPDPEAKSLILTQYKLQNRLKREVFVPGGTPDGAVRKGSFHRSINRRYPHLNATEGAARPQHRIPLKADE
ncbi:DUF7236 family protein [Streptomyces sp. MH60]|jgi:hypothetical protein|uniref:DUF7236 family protein n=1 Tax=Streptomyces sp. MH60 TaxID=1940758 RepID=UPI000CEF2840|nr:hypothetical protein [Streptomyces sp. MH60]PPS89534.1 hypothetical protein BZZ08_01680 [Streptomyces sp. MH60]